MDIQVLPGTDFQLPGQTAVYHGKVRDIYTIGRDLFVSVATDRLSAFDAVLPRAIPYKGQVLNQLAAYFLEATADIVPNWLRAVPDPNASVGLKAAPFKVEMVIRGALVGHAWREYRSGRRRLAGVGLPAGLQEYDPFPEPIITPTTKADAGHDADISADDILKQGLINAEDWARLSEYTKALFAKGRTMAQARGLVLADTKYEFGKLPDGRLILIDEVHTPDSSRYFYADSYEAYLSDRNVAKPRHLSKEFVREWLMARGFQGQPGQQLPSMDDEFVQSVSERYIELYEQMTGRAFVKAKTGDLARRIETNLINYLEKHAAD